MSETAYPWYAQINGPELEQGDVFRGYPNFRPQITSAIVAQIGGGETPSVTTDVLIYDVVVLSQSCDLANDKIDSVILCPVWDLAEKEESFGASSKEKTRRKEDIRRGREPAFHMLSADAETGMQLSLVDFRNLFSTPKFVLRDYANSCEQRVRLLPPYREHLAQAFARYFMRVGLPNDIPAFT